MGLITKFRSRARYVVGPILAISTAGYFAYHAVQGDRGMIALWHLRHRISTAQTELAETGARRQTLEHRVGLLNRSSLDPDMLDERARYMLNFGLPDETVIFIDQRKSR